MKESSRSKCTEQIKWKQTFEALESVRQGKTVDAKRVHKWLNTWGTNNEIDYTKPANP